MNLYVNFAKKCFNPKSNRLCFHTENHVNTGEKKRMSKFREEMTSQYPCFVKGRNENKAKCEICDVFISFASGGARLFITFL